MKIGDIIKEKRIKKGLTQEKVANYLNVSAPAVNKWEKGYSYPDITLIPSLARLLGTDANTLLDFKEDLIEDEIAIFLDEILAILENDSFEKAYEASMEKIKNYPNNGKLINGCAALLLAGLGWYNIENEDYYKKRINEMYQRVIDYGDEKSRQQALFLFCSDLISDGDLEKAESFIGELNDESFENKILKNSFYYKKGDFDKGAKILQEELLHLINNMQNIFLNMIGNKIMEKDFEAANQISDKMCEIADVLDLWEYSKYIGKWKIILRQKDEIKTINYLEKFINAMKNEKNIDSVIFSNLKIECNFDLSNQIVMSLVQEVKTNEELSYLNKSEKFWNFIEKYYNEIKK